MGAPYPIRFQWDGESMVPASQPMARRCDEQYVVGAHYMLEAVEERSGRSHRHYFASINEVWQNLPDEIAERFPTAEHLRKYALIRTGYRDERSITCSSKAEAQRVASYVRPSDEFSVVTVHEATVTTYTAQSQNTRAMGKKRFQESKDKVLDYLSGLIGSTREDVQQNAGRAAA